MLARPEVLTPDFLSPMPSQLLNASLADFLPAAAVPSSTATLAEAYHLIHFPLQLRASLLVADGTDPYNLPGAPFERRLWAGGHVSFHKPLPARGQEAVCRENISGVSVHGKPGQEKIFVDVLRRYGEGAMFADGDEAVTESRTLVFMKGRTPEEAKAEAAKGGRVVKGEAQSPRSIIPGIGKTNVVADQNVIVTVPYKPTYKHTLTPTPTLLFNYSALTYNAHQIHLNPQYCREIEGHRDLLVHGPLSLTLMLAVLRSQLKAQERIHSIDYRNIAPLYVGEPLSICVRPAKDAATEEQKWDVWIENNEGGLSVKGTVVVGQE